VLASSFDLTPGVVKRKKPIGIQALVAQPPIKGFDQRVIGRLARPAEVERDLITVESID
jgi:hypothetical protein